METATRSSARLPFRRPRNPDEEPGDAMGHKWFKPEQLIDLFRNGYVPVYGVR